MSKTKHKQILRASVTKVTSFFELNAYLFYRPLSDKEKEAMHECFSDMKFSDMVSNGQNIPIAYKNSRFVHALVNLAELENYIWNTSKRKVL